MKYLVEITETLQKEVEVEAETEQAALEIAKKNYFNAEDDYVLTDANYIETEFEILI